MIVHGTMRVTAKKKKEDLERSTSMSNIKPETPRPASAVVTSKHVSKRPSISVEMSKSVDLSANSTNSNTSSNKRDLQPSKAESKRIDPRRESVSKIEAKRRESVSAQQLVVSQLITSIFFVQMSIPLTDSCCRNYPNRRIVH
jgi:hypothetical protein